VIKDESIDKFLEELASDAPTPGGGSAAGIMGAIGAALVSMVCNLTVGKEKYADVDADLRAVLERSESLRCQFTDLIKADVEVFDGVMAAYGMPRDSEEQKAARGAAIQQALKAATEVPLACARACADTIAVCAEAAAKGNLNVISDAGVAVMASYAALKSAALNVYINAGSIKDEAFSKQSVATIDALIADAELDSQSIFELVKSKL